MTPTQANGLSGWISDIQRYSIHDGPGIRTTIFLKGCPLRCPWCANPETQLQKPQIVFWRARCIECNICRDVCAKGAIEIIEDGGKRASPEACDLCGDCLDECYAGALELIGRQVSVDEVLRQVEEDHSFYNHSGGGVTLSGGEPLMQPLFSQNILRRCHEGGIHTAIETSGYASWQSWQGLLPYLDLVLFDLKLINPDEHKKITGVPNHLILENLRQLAQSGKEIIVRRPVIPGYNDTEECIHELAHTVAQLNTIKEIDLLPYHRLGLGKYEQLGLNYPMGEQPSITEDDINHLRDILISYGFQVKMGG